MPKFILLTQQGKFELAIKNDQENVLDVLKRSGIPQSMVSLLVKHGSDNTYSLASVTTRFDELQPGDEVLARITRNIDTASFIPKLAIRKNDNLVTEWIESVEGKDGVISNFLVQLDRTQAEESVIDAVRNFFKEFPDFGAKKMVVGASGGGDSNALLTALKASVPPENIIVVTLVGFPDWTEASAKRATILCEQYGLKQIVVSADEVARNCGFKVFLNEAVRSFKEAFSPRELIFLSTFAIQQNLTLKAREMGINDIILGANREDVLGEALYYISRGLLPSPFPVRSFDEYRFGFPLWLVPKKVIDGVHPKMSVENYEERDPGSTHWRDRFYFLAHLLEDSGIGGDLLMLKGLSELSRENKKWLGATDESGVFMAGAASDIGKGNWASWLKTVTKN